MKTQEILRRNEVPAGPVAMEAAEPAAAAATIVGTRDLALGSSVLRLALWLIVIGLTAALLAYPRELVLDYSPIQSLDAVRPLPIFASLYYAWMVTLTALLLLQSRDSLWQGLALVGIFVLVYSGFWDIPFAAVKHQDSVLNATTAEYIRAAGAIPVGHPNIIYTDFPGLHILTAALGTVAGLAMPWAVTAMTLLMDLLRAGALFLICVCLLEDPRWAGIAALVVMQGSIVFARLPFYPGTLGMVFASMFLLMALRQRQIVFARRSGALLAIALLAATTVTHFVTSALLVFLLVGMGLVAYFRRGLKEPFQSSTLLLCVYGVVLTAWLVYAAAQTFDALVLVSAEISNNLRQGRFLRELFIVGRSNFGQVPLWVTTLKLFWLVLLFGVGTVAALPGFRRLQSLRSVEARALGALLGILLLSVTATLVSTAGSQFLRYSMYAPLVTAPLLLLAMSRLSEGLHRVGLGAVVVSLVALAVPTFLAHYPTVRMDMFYPYEAAPAQMLSRYTDGTDLSLNAPALGYVPYIGYLPNAEYASTPDLSGLKDESGVWAHLEDQVDSFVGGTDERVKIYVLSRRPRVFYRHNLGIPLDDPRWDAIQSRLEGEAEVYDNGFVTLYESTVSVARSGGRDGH